MNYRNIELEFIGFKMHKPHNNLIPYVQCYWSIYKEANLLKPIRNKIVSDGGSGIVFNYGCPLAIKIGDNTVKDIHGCFITGPTIKATYLTLDGSVNAVGIRFRPGGAYPFIKKCLGEYRDTVQIQPIDDENIWNELMFQLKNESPNELICLIDNFLLRELSKSKLILSNWLISTINIILKHNGSMRIDDLCADMNISRKKLERNFKQAVGLLPKQLSRVVRLDKSRSLIRSLEFHSLADIAYESGFFDQAHFIHEFKALVGTTPKKYFEEKKEMSLFYNS